jgi:hypothetical protein
MFRLPALAALVALAVLAGSVSAERVPSRRVPSQPTTGGRVNIFVPYTTNGTSTLGVSQGVSPFIYSGPTVNDPRNTGILPVYNLIFYGSKQSFDSSNPGAMPRKPNTLRPNRR